MLDMAKAFDTVDRTILLKVLSNIIDNVDKNQGRSYRLFSS